LEIFIVDSVQVFLPVTPSLEGVRNSVVLIILKVSSSSYRMIYFHSLTSTGRQMFFSGGVPVGVLAHLIIRSNGSYIWSAHSYDSGFPSYDVSIVGL